MTYSTFAPRLAVAIATYPKQKIEITDKVTIALTKTFGKRAQIVLHDLVITPKIMLFVLNDVNIIENDIKFSYHETYVNVRHLVFWQVKLSNVLIIMLNGKDESA